MTRLCGGFDGLGRTYIQPLEESAENVGRNGGTGQLRILVPEGEDVGEEQGFQAGEVCQQPRPVHATSARRQ